MLAIADTTDLDRGPRAKPGTERMCVVSRQVKGIDDLIRFVRAPTGEVVPDVRRKLPGRGAWISADKTALDTAIEKKLFGRAFRGKGKADRNLPQLVETLLRRAALDALSIANKAGRT